MKNILFLIFIFSTYYLQSQHVEEDSIHEKVLHEVTIFGTHIEKVSNTLSQVNLNQNQIQSNLDNSLTETLARIPGVQGISTGNIISKPIIRGLSGNRIVVANNGIPIEDQQWGDDHGLAFNQFDADQVTVIKGPATLALGSGALGGGIAISSRRIPENPTQDISILSYYRSNDNAIGLVINYFEKYKNNWFVELTANTSKRQSFTLPTNQLIYDQHVLNLSGHKLDNTGGDNQNMSLRFGKKNETGFWAINGSYMRQLNGLFNTAYLTEHSHTTNDHTESELITQQVELTDDYWKVQRPNAQLQNATFSFNGETSKNNHKWLWNTSYQFNWRQELEAEHHEEEGSELHEDEEEELGGHIFKLHTISQLLEYELKTEKSEIHVGLTGEYQMNRFTEEYIIPNYEQLKMGLYGIMEYNLSDKLLLSGGVRFDFMNLHSSHFFSEDSHDGETLDISSLTKNYFNISGSVGLKYHFTPHQDFKLNIARTFRFPNIAELKSYGDHISAFRFEIGNPDLKTETAYQFDIIYEYRNKETSFSINPYLNWFTNYIYIEEQDNNTYLYQNDKALFTGVEANLDTHFFDFIHFNLGGEYLYSQNLDADSALPRTPPARIMTGLFYEPNTEQSKVFKTPIIGIEYKYNFKQDRIGLNESITDGYSLLRFKAQTILKIKDSELNIGLRINNLLNTKYLNHLSLYRPYDIPNAGIDYVLSIGYKF